MPNLLANVELSTAQAAPATWADVLGMSAVVDVESPDSVILLMATIPFRSAVSIDTAEFRFAVGGVREGPFAEAQHQAPTAIGSADMATFAYALTGLSGSQTFSVQWQQVMGILDLNTAKIRNFQVIEILPGDRLNILDQVVEQSSAIDSAAAYAVVGGLTVTVPVEDTDSLILMAGTLPVGLTDATDRVASCQMADGGVVEGGEAIIYQDFVFEGTGLTTLMRAKTGISGSHTFSLQWKTELANSAAKVSLVDTRVLQVLEFRPGHFPQFETVATNGSGAPLTTHTIDTPAGVVAGDLLIAMIALENISRLDLDQWSGWTDGFIEIKDKTPTAGEGVSVGVAYKISDGTEGIDIEVDSVDSERSTAMMVRYSRHDPALAPDISFGRFGLIVGGNTSPDPDPITPAGGLPIKDFVYLALAAFQDGADTFTGFPPKYDDNQTQRGEAGGATMGMATRDRSVSTEDPGLFAMSGVGEEWQAFGLAIHPNPDPIAGLTGTATATIEENDILDGGKTIILTLTGDTWVAAGAPFDAIRQDIIDGLNSAQSSSTGLRLWNDEVRDKEVVGAVVRTSDTIVTITLTASPLYNIFSTDPLLIQETITVTVPASALATSPFPVVASPSFTVDQSPVSVEITGTLDGSDETDIVAGGRTMLLTLKQAGWETVGFSGARQDIIDGLNSAQSELTGWNAEVRDKMPVTDVVRTSSTLVTITLSAQAGYNITAPEVITATIPSSAIEGNPPPFDATPDINIAVGPATAALSGTVTPASTEAQMVAGGRTLIITLADEAWVASGAAFNAARQAIIDGITSAQVEVTGWNNEIRDNLPVGQVVRTSDTVVTVSFTPEAGYNITDFEEITVTVPASAVVGAAPIVSTPTFFIFEVPVALITGTVTPEVDEVDLVAGGKTIIITLIDDEWLAAGVPFDDSRQEIVDEITASTTQPNGWNQDIRDNIPPSNVIRTSDTVVTITLQAQASYQIDQNETVTVTVPGSALDQTPNDIIGVPTFRTITEKKSSRRGRRGGRHAEDVFDVNEPTVETFEVNKFD